MRESRKFVPVEGSEDKIEVQLADMVHELTGDWVSEIECKEIEQLHDSVIYFGSKDFLETEAAQDFVEAAVWQRFEHYGDEQQVFFAFNTSSKCRKKMGLDKEGKYMVFHNGELKNYVLDLDAEMPEDINIDAHFYMA